MTVLRRVARNVGDLGRAVAFYETACGFSAIGAVYDDPALAQLLRVERVTGQRLASGHTTLELTVLTPSGAAYPAGAQSCDVTFQHIAIVTRDAFAAARAAVAAGGVAISQGGPVQLPIESGGALAWKFRDPDGHPLEFIQFPSTARDGAVLGRGYDHSAIVVAKVARSIAFYEAHGFICRQSQVNAGAAQTRLDDIEAVKVEVVAMVSPAGGPHIELLGYGATRAGKMDFTDIAADRLVLSGEAGTLRLGLDPDGHALLFDGRY
jgi:catechol 2,3-dioxygenase-like lactoylglutathione lyase family enzyme